MNMIQIPDVSLPCTSLTVLRGKFICARSTHFWSRGRWKYKYIIL